ncbi:tetratricopeptide repeat protein [Bacteroidota bacterium]
MWIRQLAIAGLTLLLTSGVVRAQEIPYEVKVNYSLAAENFKNGDYESALPYLRWLLINAPTVYNGERIHRRAVDTYAALADAAEEEGLISAYLDTALIILRTGPTTLKDAEVEFNEARWELDFGNFIERHGNIIANLEETAVEHWLRAYELDPAGIDPYYIRKIIEDYVLADRADEAVAFMKDVEQHHAANTELMQYFDVTRNELFKSPEERIEFLVGQLAGEPDNIDLVRELFGIYGAMQMSAEQEEMGGRLLELDPSTATYIELGDIKNSNADYRAALDMYAKALESLEDDSELKRDLEYKMAMTNYDLGNLQTARVHARRALGHDKSFGFAYFLIGDLLAKAVQDSEFEREDRAVYWLAMDYYERASVADPSLRSKSSQKVKQFQQYMPTKEDKFFQGWKEGDEYVINYGRYAWVNETTHIR